MTGVPDKASTCGEALLAVGRRHFIAVESLFHKGSSRQRNEHTRKYIQSMRLSHERVVS